MLNKKPPCWAVFSRALLLYLIRAPQPLPNICRILMNNKDEANKVEDEYILDVKCHLSAIGG